MGDKRGKTMPEQTAGQTQDVTELWREWLTQTERQFNAFFSQTMNSEPFARNMSGYMEMTAALQSMVTDGMQRYLTFMNMPSRTDVTGMGETLRSIEDRLSRIEEMLQIAAEAIDMTEDDPRREPSRTRIPPGYAPVEETRQKAGAVPEGLRR